jgi:hypothetical protein
VARAPRDSTNPTTADFPEVTPRNLHDTSDIRFVMIEIGKLTTGMEGLTKSIDKLVEKVEKQGDKIEDLRRSVSFVRGIVWAFGILGILVVPILGWLLNHNFPPSPVAKPPQVAPQVTTPIH